MGGVDSFKDMGFLLKFIAMVVNIVAFVFWLIGKEGDIPTRSYGQRILFYHCLPAYMIILIGFVILYLIDEIPGQWAQRFFGLVGAILFIIFGVIAVLNAMDNVGTTQQLLIAILCLVVGALLLADFLKREFC